MIDKNTDFFSTFPLSTVRPYRIIKKGNYLQDALLTIIITTYNRDKLLYESLDSALNQKTKYPYKVLVIDNHSLNSIVNTSNFINKYSDVKNVTIVENNDNYGMFGNMNQGALLADTDYISFLHDDDLYMENFVEEVMDIIMQKNDISALHVGVAKVVNGEKFNVNYDGKLKKTPIYDILFNGPVAPTGLIINRKQFLKNGGYNEDYHPTSDFCLAVLMAHKTNYYKYSKPLCYYRIEDNESLKIETLSLFVRHDFFLRNYVLEQYNLPDFIINGIQRYRVPFQIYGLRNSFNKDFYFDFRLLGIEKEGNWFWYAVCRLIVIMWISIKNILKKR